MFDDALGAKIIVSISSTFYLWKSESVKQTDCKNVSSSVDMPEIIHHFGLDLFPAMQLNF